MPVALVCMSHSPLLRFAEPPAEVRAAVDDAFGRVREFVADYDPTLVVSFAPDHYNGFFYELMPPFCVGYEAESVGDYGTQLATLDVATDVAERLAAHVMGHDIDMAISRRMRVDHGRCSRWRSCSAASPRKGSSRSSSTAWRVRSPRCVESGRWALRSATSYGALTNGC